MLTKYVSLALVVIVTFGAAARVSLGQTAVDPASQQIKRDLDPLAKNDSTKIEVTTKDGAKRKGFVTKKLDDSFDLTDSKSKQLANIPYREVAKVKKPGWSTGAKVGLGAAIGAGAVIAILLIAIKNANIGEGLSIGGTR